MTKSKKRIYPIAESEYNLPQNIPRKTYSVLLCDAPWRVNQTGYRGAEMHYPLLSMEEIQSLPVPDLLAEDAFVWMWVPNGLIDYACDILRGWDLRILSVLTWWKSGSFPLGNTLRHSTEQLILAAKGHPKFQFHSQPSLLICPQLGHSVKPDEIFPIIERCCGKSGNMLELFARRKYSEKWDVWGNEVSSDAYISGFPVPSYSFDPNYQLKFKDKALAKIIDRQLAKTESAKAKAKVKTKSGISSSTNIIPGEEHIFRTCSATIGGGFVPKEVITSDSGKPDAKNSEDLLHALPLSLPAGQRSTSSGGHTVETTHHLSGNIPDLDNISNHQKA